MLCKDPTPGPTNTDVCTNLASYFFGSWKDLDQPYDYVVIGGGAYGTAFAERILALSATAKVLVLEKGTIFFPDHSQNLPPAYVNAVYGPATAPWICEGDYYLAPQQPYVGGRALFWNAWVPQPRPFEFPSWPAEVVDGLKQEWYAAGEAIGRRFSLACDGNDNATLDQVARSRLFAGNDRIECAVPLTAPTDLDSAMATGAGVAPGQFAKYAPVKKLTALAQQYANRLKVVPLTTVTAMQADGGRITSLQLSATGQDALRKTLPVQQAQVILANNTIEAASLALTAFPQHPLLGKNLCVHNRSALTFRIPAANFPRIADQMQVCAYYQLSQVDEERFFHNHISVVYNPHPQEDNDLLYRVLPDASSAQSMLMYQETGYVYVLIQALGEVLGERSAQSWNSVARHGDETIVTLRSREKDDLVWQSMNQSVFDIVEVLADGAPVEYMHAAADNPLALSWQPVPPQICSRMSFHEAGTLWMGADPGSSVTDVNGTLHGVANLHGTGSMLFPSPGSWNPTYTGLALAYRLARHLNGLHG